ncbi:phage antirepressor KilAC domain-containing protein [Gordonia sp. ABSL49_1]|uniref:phage antirepressor KilAC domain-containing protein n=1 Tax=Gordonia sp. ABSL49_1 TaxID=2920941 RepID=UPI001F10C797|nr:phage antirepressor KilAC domain-containing protein [Gordonia sp. ABSL49_1]MCH5645120.1 phage antirepressor KilAC domain-containing protein [Gordonia sp. ABSL49_1]
MTRHPVDSGTRSCCGGIGGHTQDCNPVARMTPGGQATYRRLTRHYGRDGIVAALVSYGPQDPIGDFTRAVGSLTDHSRPGCCPVESAHAGDSGKPEIAAAQTYFVIKTREAETRPAINGGDITRMELIQLAMNAETERLALEAKNAELEPKAEAYDNFLDATGKYSVGAVAKMLGTSQNKLFRDLRNAGVFIPKGSMRNTPYQQYMHHFEVKAHEYERNSGEWGCSYTTYVQPSGIDFIRRKLGLPTIDPIPALATNQETDR